MTSQKGDISKALAFIQNGRLGIASGSMGRGRATVITPPAEGSLQTGVSQFGMTNFNRDRRMAGAGDDMTLGGLDEDDVDYAEVLDLADDEDNEDGGFRRV